MTTTTDEVEVLPASILWGVMAIAAAAGIVSGGLMVAITVSIFPGIGWRHFEADRACRPGMVSELLPSGRDLCVGGDGETWVVRYR